MKLTRLAGAAGIAIIALGAIGCNAGPGGGTTYNVGIDMPQQGSELAGSQPVINGALLALKQAGGKAGTYTVKFPLVQQGKTEHIWLQVDEYKGGKFQGRLANEPTIGNEYRKGQALSVAEGDVEDWMVKAQDGIYGGYVTRYVMKDMPEPQRRKISALFRD